MLKFYIFVFIRPPIGFTSTNVANINMEHLIRPNDAVIAVTFAPYTEMTIDMATKARTDARGVIELMNRLDGKGYLEAVIR